MTKEEALKQNVPLYFSSDYDGPGEEAEWHTGAALAESIYKSMDQYADQQSIGFAEWLDNEGWVSASSSVKGYWQRLSADQTHMEGLTLKDLLAIYKGSF